MLYIVGTPIGNLKELTPRAKEVLESVEYIACEDTRTSGILFAHYNMNYINCVEKLYRALRGNSPLERVANNEV